MTDIPAPDDTDVVTVMRLCAQARCEVHVRGSEARPVVEFTTRRSFVHLPDGRKACRHMGRVVGFVELKRRVRGGA